MLGERNPVPGNAVAQNEAVVNDLAIGHAPNLVDGMNALSAYYRYLEAAAYNAELKTARDRRNFRDEFLQRIEALLSYHSDGEAQRQIQREIDKEAAAFGAGRASNRSSDVASEARSRDAEGYALLALSTSLTWDSLRAAYRAAAKRYHPDVGGDDATMQKVNNAYALFTAILRRSGAQEAVADGRSFVAVDSVNSLFSEILLAKFSLLIDDLAGDVAYDVYKLLTLQDIEESYGVELVARLCRLLAAAGRKDDATTVLADLQKMVEWGTARQLNYEPVYINACDAVKDPKRIRFIPNHDRQASNLLRLGIIDKIRYESLLKRIDAAESQVNQGELEFTEYVRARQFMRLQNDPLPDDKPIDGLVPAPGYFSRVETLSPVQLREYAKAFHARACELVSKYFVVRLDALLREPFIGGRDIDAVLDELRFLSNAPGLRGSQPTLSQEAITVVQFLANLTPSEREKRIYLLNSLDGLPGKMEIVITVGSPCITGGPRLPRPIFLNAQFTKFATGPLERIERYARTGSEETAQERESEQKRRQDSRAFHESEVYKRARDVTWAKQKDPAEVVAAVGALCEAMYERAAQGDSTMEIGYWTNDLTINLVKLKRYDEALRWIDRLSTTSSEIQQRTPGSVVAALAKRRGRCLSASSER
ncbi:MAG TPA: hypothetical protein VMF11_08415 [Candidatus Baltobacteraceae bacterium]|nr:hypothetical protein [Candidatus Baltobacteraceae bacterium]